MIEYYLLKNEDFNIQKILESGQNFQYEKFKDFYVIIINNKKIYIQSLELCSIFGVNEDFFNAYLYELFDLKTDYKKIRYKIEDNFPELKHIINFGKGLRFINQPL